VLFLSKLPVSKGMMPPGGANCEQQLANGKSKWREDKLMDYKTYRQRFFIQPPPQPRFAFAGLHGLTLYFADFEAALAYYQGVLGPPAYVEGAGTRGWQLGHTWLTLLKGTAGNPQNLEVMIVMETPAEAERLQAAFIMAGGVGEAPSDQLMYEPVRSCPVKDPFGTQILITCPLPA
jgi:hypothetical protein